MATSELHFSPPILPNSIIFSSHFLSLQTLTPISPSKPSISSKWKRNRRSKPPKSTRLVLESLAFVASSLKILPEPLDLLIREFGGGNGGKLGFRNGFGGGGFDGWRKMKSKIRFWIVLMVSSGLALWVILERERETKSDLIWGFLVVSIFLGYYLVKGWKREMKDWVLGFCCGAALMGLGFKNENLGNWVYRFRACFPIKVIDAKAIKKNKKDWRSIF